MSTSESEEERTKKDMSMDLYEYLLEWADTLDEMPLDSRAAAVFRERIEEVREQEQLSPRVSELIVKCYGQRAEIERLEARINKLESLIVELKVAVEKHKMKTKEVLGKHNPLDLALYKILNYLHQQMGMVNPDMEGPDAPKWTSPKTAVLTKCSDENKEVNIKGKKCEACGRETVFVIESSFCGVPCCVTEICSFCGIATTFTK